ncbi:hypothetical protein SGCOL_007053 [Colletotrichum sp. CLE4]
MRLLNVKTRKLQEFFVKVPRYVILSHTWGDDEVTFQDLDDPEHTKKRGYAKTDGLCYLAAQNGFQWVWVDTCCIDKTSSAELSEAINSMYRWYANAFTCCAYLEDVQPEDDPNSFVSRFGQSRWFTRGWTLQELLAPGTVSFFNAAWKNIGTRASLALKISSITNIPIMYLKDSMPRAHIRNAKVAERMAWAAWRQTTRKEDRAYSLLGLFDVNMPLLYGEGERAFERLQLEVMKQFPDDSILAWGLTRELMTPNFIGDTAIQGRDKNVAYDALASSPTDFAGWVGTQAMTVYERNSITEMTNRGLRVTLPVFKGLSCISYGVLNCMVDDRFNKILTVKLVETTVIDEYIRPHCELVILPWQIVKNCERQTIYIKKSGQQSAGENPTWDVEKEGGMVRIQHLDDCPEHLVEVAPTQAYRKAWNSVVISPPENRHSKRTLLHYRRDPMDDARDGSTDEDGYVVVFDPRSPLGAFCSLEMEPPPFVCYTIPMPKGERLGNLLLADLSQLRNRFSLKAGVPRAETERDNFLGQDLFLVKIFRTQSLAEYAGYITNMYLLLVSRGIRSLYRNPSFSGDDLFLGLVPIVTWWLNSKRCPTITRWKETVTCSGLAFFLYLLRRKAVLAFRSSWEARLQIRQSEADFCRRTVYMPFAVLLPFSMYTLFPRSRKEVKINPLVSVVVSTAVVELLGRKFFGRAWHRMRWQDMW